MDVELVSDLPFSSWPEFRKQVLAVDPAAALALVQQFTLTVAEEDEGVFRGKSPIVPTTLHVLVREWIAALPPECLPALNTSATDEIGSVLLRASRELNGLRATHPALVRSPLILSGDLKLERTLRSLWFTYLEQQGLNWVPKFELGRSQRMFVEIWKELRDSQRVKYRSTESTAFLSPSYALLMAMGVWRTQGIVNDVRELFQPTQLSDDTLSTLLDAVAVPLLEVQRVFQEATQFPSSIQNYFQRYPLIRVGRWGVFAPLPDLLLQSWDLRNLFDNLELTLANVGERGGAEFYRALGVVFEVYVHDLLKELANLSNGSFVAPFKCDNGSDSADGFVLTPNLPPVCFEVKCYRIPQAAYGSADLSSFTSWFASLLGTNEKGRAPLVQGANFFQAWRAADKAILSNLGPDSENAIYLIVSYEDIPMFCVWRRFRDWYARMHLDPSTKALWSRTAVISVRELETLVAAAKARSASGGSFPLVHMLRDYLAYRDNAPDAVADPPSVKDGLGDWLARADESVRAQEPTIIADARNRLFEHAQECGFGEVTQELGGLTNG